MPNENIARASSRLNVELLEGRTLPASFGATTGLSIALGDVVPSSGANEYVTGTGPGRQALVRVWSGDGNVLLFSLNPFRQFSGGVNVAIGDINNDGLRELIVSTAAGTTGQVKVYNFNNGGIQRVAAFTPFGPNYSGGVDLAVGDVTGSRQQEIIVGMQSGGSSVKAFSYDATNNPTFFQVRGFQAFGPSYTGGVAVASANTDITANSMGNPYNFNYSEVIVGKASAAPLIRIFDIQNPTPVLRTSYFAFDQTIASNRMGVNVAAGNTDGVRGAEIYVALKGGSTIKYFSGQTGVNLGQVRVFPNNFSKMVNMTIAQVDDDFLGTFSPADLSVVAADGKYEQVPFVYPGAAGSPAGNNGVRPAP